MYETRTLFCRNKYFSFSDFTRVVKQAEKKIHFLVVKLYIKCRRLKRSRERFLKFQINKRKKTADKFSSLIFNRPEKPSTLNLNPSALTLKSRLFIGFLVSSNLGFIFCLRPAYVTADTLRLDSRFFGTMPVAAAAATDEHVHLIAPYRPPIKLANLSRNFMSQVQLPKKLSFQRGEITFEQFRALHPD